MSSSILSDRSIRAMQLRRPAVQCAGGSGVGLRAADLLRYVLRPCRDAAAPQGQLAQRVQAVLQTAEGLGWEAEGKEDVRGAPREGHCACLPCNVVA